MDATQIPYGYQPRAVIRRRDGALTSDCEYCMLHCFCPQCKSALRRVLWSLLHGVIRTVTEAIQQIPRFFELLRAWTSVCSDRDTRTVTRDCFSSSFFFVIFHVRIVTSRIATGIGIGLPCAEGISPRSLVLLQNGQVHAVVQPRMAHHQGGKEAPYSSSTATS